MSRIAWAWWLLSLASCVADVASDVAVVESGLEQRCIAVAADEVGVVNDELVSAVPRRDGCALCSGVVFDFDNPEGQLLWGAWVDAGGVGEKAPTLFDEAHCEERKLAVDFWGYRDAAWTQLATTIRTGRYESGECIVYAQINHVGTYEKLRLVAKPNHPTPPDPVKASVWSALR